MRIRRPVQPLLLSILVPACLSAPAFAAEALGPAVGASGEAELGVGYVSDDNFTFGRYNGWNREGAKLAGNINYLNWNPQGLLGGNVDYLQFKGLDLGLDTRQMRFSMGGAGSYELSIAYDEQLQAGNFTGRTPYSGGDTLTLPADWVASNNTSGMLGFDTSAGRLEQELERKRWSIELSKSLGSSLSLRGGFSSEEKTGTQAQGAALYVDGSNGHAAILPRPVDFTTNEFDLALAYSRSSIHVDVSYLYSGFDNDSPGLAWQNPYTNVFGADVDYPAGFGQMALEPDTEMHSFRMRGSYLYSPRLRATVDGSWTKSTQDDTYLPYTVNPALTVSQGLPATDLDGEVVTSTFNAGVYLRPLKNLSLEAKWHYLDRDNDTARNGYQYVRGDAMDQPASLFTVYNSTRDRTLNRFDLEGHYRLPWSSRLTASYGYEEIDRTNAAVSKTEEDIYELVFSTRHWEGFSIRLEGSYSDRAASTYNWDQSYYALLDTELINLTPDSQRYINHPLLFQYHLANRDQWLGRLNLGYASAADWSVNFNLVSSENEYDKSDLGLLEDERTSATLSANLLASKNVNLTFYYSYDSYSNEQMGRAFRGGLEKNAFEINPPLPQASDPERNWKTESDDESQSVGVTLQWQLSERLVADLDYSYVDSTGEQEITTFGAPDLDDEPLPDLENQQHIFQLAAKYQFRERLSLKVDYRFHHFEDDNWALDGVHHDSMDKVLWSGEESPDDDIHFFQASVIYRLEN